jgi:formylglycine-generating enzyme required for sulfatase activity
MYKTFLTIIAFIVIFTLLLPLCSSSSKAFSNKKSFPKSNEALIAQKAGEDGNIDRFKNKDVSLKRSFKNLIGQKFVYIRPGSFMMGSNSYDLDEKPVHRVTLTRGFYMQTTEVTQGQWLEIMGTRPWSGKKYLQERRDKPAVYISWRDVKMFIRRLNLRDVKRYRLPTEAEWEYACRAGSNSMYSFGDTQYRLGEYAWYRKNAWDMGKKYGHSVGTKRPNLWGLYNMHGNVYEWCEDWYNKNYYLSSSVTDPMGPSSGSYRVLRGVSWADSANSCRSSNRNRSKPDQRDSYTGFRLVCFYAP